jgi:hypothetical protein
MFMAFTWGSWITAYVGHSWIFASERYSGRQSSTREERKARTLAAEINQLKSELQHK